MRWLGRFALMVLCIFSSFSNFGLVFAKTVSPSSSPFLIRNEVDLPILLGAIPLASMPVLFRPELKYANGDYDRDDVFFLDRPVINYDLKAFDVVSDILAFGVPTATVLKSLPWGEGRAWSTSYEDILMIAQSVALTSLTNQMVRLTVERPRPYLYRGDSSDIRNNQEDHTSFFSGHTANVFAAGVTFWRIQSIRNPKDPVNRVYGIAAFSAGTLAGISRVLSGEHFWTDAIAGAAVGISIGLLVPALHRKRSVDAQSVPFISVGPGSVALGVNF